MAKAAFELDSQDPVLAFRVFDAVLVDDPDNVIALVGKGVRLGAEPDIFANSPDIAAEGLRLLDRAVELSPESGEARLYRALAHQTQQNLDSARQDLDLIDRSALPAGLVPLFDQISNALG